MIPIEAGRAAIEGSRTQPFLADGLVVDLVVVAGIVRSQSAGVHNPIRGPWLRDGFNASTGPGMQCKKTRGLRVYCRTSSNMANDVRGSLQSMRRQQRDESFDKVQRFKK